MCTACYDFWGKTEERDYSLLCSMSVAMHMCVQRAITSGERQKGLTFAVFYAFGNTHVCTACYDFWGKTEERDQCLLYSMPLAIHICVQHAIISGEKQERY